MKLLVRPLFALVLALGSIVAVSTSWAMATAIPLLAAHTTALIMGGTFHPLKGPKDGPDFVTAYLHNAVDSHLNPAFTGPVDNAVAVYTPEEFFPIGKRTLDKSVAEGRANLHKCLSGGDDCDYNDDPAVVAEVGSVAPELGDSFMVFGYSQSAVVASLVKRDLIGEYETGAAATSFMLVANPMRPNGGVLQRGIGWPTIPILGISFAGASPTDSVLLPDGTYAYPTIDVARQYDGFGGDFPVRPLNLLALVNALLGYGLLHGETVNVPLDQARYQGSEGDTTYYLIETEILPILQPFAFFIPKPILKALDAPLRVIIEDAYDREIGPGTPTAFSWWPVEDLFGMAVKLLKSVPVAIDNFFEGFGLPRVLGTEAPGTFGVGGPDLPADPAAVQPQQAALTSVGDGSEPLEPEPVPDTDTTEIEPLESVEGLDDSAGVPSEEPAPTTPAEAPVAPDADAPGVEEITPPEEEPDEDAPHSEIDAGTATDASPPTIDDDAGDQPPADNDSPEADAA